MNINTNSLQAPALHDDSVTTGQAQAIRVPATTSAHTFSPPPAPAERPGNAFQGLQLVPPLGSPRRPPSATLIGDQERALVHMPEHAEQVRGWATEHRWPQVSAALTTAAQQRRLDVLLGWNMGGQTLAATLLQAMETRQTTTSLPSGQLAAVGMASLRAREMGTFLVWLGLLGDGLATVVREHGGLARQAATDVSLFETLFAPLASADRAAIFLANAAPIVRALMAQVGASPRAETLLAELVDSVLESNGARAAEGLLRQAPALLAAGRGRPQMEAIRARLYLSSGHVPPISRGL